MLAYDLNYKDGDFISYEEFKILEKQCECKIEYVDGKVYFLADTSNEHSFIIRNISVIINEYLKDKPCMLFTEGKALYYWDDKLKKELYVFPDIMIVCDFENHLKDKDNKYYGHPKLIMEVISKNNAERDTDYKKQIYKQIGIEEYVIIDQYKSSIEIFNINNKYKISTKMYNEGIFCSRSYPGLKINLEEIFKYPI